MPFLGSIAAQIPRDINPSTATYPFFPRKTIALLQSKGYSLK
jgi:hypothetical protein